jgi:hypothetical protein
MKLCSQCHFIYEDDQERCDMDGAELVYEPTLETVPQSALEAHSKLERLAPARLIIPISRSLPETSTGPTHVVAPGRRVTLQLAAGIVLAMGTLAALYTAPRFFQSRAETSATTIEKQSLNRETSNSSPINPNKSQATGIPVTKTSLLETGDSTPATISTGTDKPEQQNAKRETSVPALPGLKPLPRLKPLPTLKPLPRFADQSRSRTANRKPSAVTTKDTTNAKKESRFGSFLKKTGRILTKPFKS